MERPPQHQDIIEAFLLGQAGNLEWRMLTVVWWTGLLVRDFKGWACTGVAGQHILQCFTNCCPDKSAAVVRLIESTGME